MYSKFVITLRKVGFEKKEFPDAPEILKIEFDNLIRLINEQVSNDLFKHYCILNLNEILKQEREIENRLNKLELKPEELKTLPFQEIEARQSEFRYFCEIHNWSGDAVAALVEYLANYYPIWNTDPENLEFIRKILPKHNTVRQMVEQEQQKKTEKVKSPFSVPEWATIFYYADETKLLPNNRFKKTRMEQFMNKHKVNTTFDTFKKDYHIAIKRINEKNDYPIDKLELIIPFLIENYKQTVTKVKNDIIFLKENKPDY